MKRFLLFGVVVLSALVFGMFITCGSKDDEGPVLEDLANSEYKVYYNPSFVYSGNSKIVTTDNAIIFTTKDKDCLAQMGISPENLKGGRFAGDGAYTRKWENLRVESKLVGKDDYKSLMETLEPFLPSQINPADIIVESIMSFTIYDAFKSSKFPIGVALYTKGKYGESMPGYLSALFLIDLNTVGFIFK
jgi:hypothetical protein